MAAEGAAVAVGDIDADGGRSVVDEIERDGGQGLFVLADVSRAADTQQLVDATVERFGALHILHNNAYWARSGRTVLTLDEADWDRTLDGVPQEHVFDEPLRRSPTCCAPAAGRSSTWPRRSR